MRQGKRAITEKKIGNDDAQSFDDGGLAVEQSERAVDDGMLVKYRKGPVEEEQFVID